MSAEEYSLTFSEAEIAVLRQALAGEYMDLQRRIDSAPDESLTSGLRTEMKRLEALTGKLYDAFSDSSSPVGASTPTKAGVESLPAGEEPCAGDLGRDPYCSSDSAFIKILPEVPALDLKFQDGHRQCCRHMGDVVISLDFGDQVSRDGQDGFKLRTSDGDVLAVNVNVSAVLDSHDSSPSVGTRVNGSEAESSVRPSASTADPTEGEPLAEPVLRGEQ